MFRGSIPKLKNNRFFMKHFFKKIVLRLLKAMAMYRMKKFNGKIIGITGSVGKSSTKDAIFTVLNTQFKVKKTKKNMNSDFGLLLTILDIESGFSSAPKWSWFLLKGLFNCLMRDHSEILLLEFGIDKPGDMDFLVSVVKPDIAIVTEISPVHMDEGQFETLQAIFDEKSKLVEALREHGIAILNIDNDIVANFAKKRGKKSTVTFGKNREADFWASQIKQSLEGLDFILHHDNKRYDVHVDVIGEYQSYVILPAIACGVILGMPVENVVSAIKKYTLPPGRMNAVPAINEAIILDSSYNASPEAMKEALKTLAEIGGARRKIAALGNMNELGRHSKIMHEMIGGVVPQCADILITVGDLAVTIADKAKEKGMDEKNIFSFKTSLEAAGFFAEKIKKNDIILVKGSQNNVRLERFVKALMANPEQAKDLLVRQEPVWITKM